MDKVAIDDLKVWPLAEDIDAENDDATVPKSRRQKDWEPLFISEDFFSPQE